MEKPIIPTFSQSERARRWGIVRDLMRRANLDALICLPNQGHWDQFGADARYLTQIGGFQTEVAVVLPLESDVTAIVRGQNEIEGVLCASSIGWCPAGDRSIIARRVLARPTVKYPSADGWANHTPRSSGPL